MAVLVLLLVLILVVVLILRVILFLSNSNTISISIISTSSGNRVTPSLTDNISTNVIILNINISSDTCDDVQVCFAHKLIRNH